MVVIDRWGNVAALVHSINTNTWGETGLFVGGVSIPDAAAIQQRQILEAGPGQRLAEGTIPLIVFRDGQPIAGLGSIGSGLFPRTIAVLLNLTDAGMDIEEAIRTPSAHMPQYTADGPIPQILEGGFSPELLARVAEMGLDVKVFSRAFDPDNPFPRGMVVGAGITPGSGLRKAVSTRHLNGIALGY